jgi:hypothetical protein
MDAAVQTPTPSPAGARRRRFVILVASIVLLSVGYLAIEANQRDAANEALLNDLFQPKSPPPARMMVCEGAMDSACAQDAADQASTTFAWLDEPAGYELGWVIATGDPQSPEGPAIASEYLLGPGGQGMIEVVTSLPAIEVEPGTPPTSSVSNGADTASVWVDEDFGLVSMEWTHEGIGYVLTAQPRPWDPSSVVQAWKTIRYTSPRPA